MAYNLENLSWQEFERFTKFYLKEKIGEGLWVFDGSQDMGRDAAFIGKANEFPSKSDPYTGNWIFQAKHRTTRSKSLNQVERELLKSLEDELHKIFVKHNFKCDNYVYIISLSVSNQFRDQASGVFAGFCGKHDLSAIHFNVIEYKDFDVYLSNNATIRYSFPTLLRFADLETIFLKKENTKNKGYLKSAQQRIDRFVSTEHYLECARRIRDYNYLMLVGNPKSGKTSIVEALALCFLDDSHYKPYFIRNTDEFYTITSYLSQTEGALFICDDIFGIHELDRGKQQEWTDYFQSVMGLVESNRKFIFTTRQYIFEEFAKKSNLQALFPDKEDPAYYVVKLSELTKDERDQILEKHLLTSNLSPQVMKIVRESKDEILNCNDFSPEIIRSLVSLLGKAKPTDVPKLISKHISQPNQYLYDFFDNIDAQKKLLLLSIAISPSSETPDIENSFLTLLKDTSQQPEVMFETFIDEIDGSIVNRREYHETSEIDYYHPSMYDVIVGICKKDQYYRGLMLQNVNLETISLITFNAVNKKSNKIQVFANELGALSIGVERLLSTEKMVSNVARLIQWTSFINVEIAGNPAVWGPFATLKSTIRTRLTSPHFFEAHANAPIEHWISLLDKWRLLGGQEPIQYASSIEHHFRDYRAYDYWRLVFLLESSNSGFIKNNIDPRTLEIFIQEMKEVVKGLRLGLNIQGGRPKTEEFWYPLFREADDLITKMKRSGIGQQIIDGHLLSDRAEVKQYSDFAKNRHAGMVKAGYWKTYKQLRNFRVIAPNA